MGRSNGNVEKLHEKKKQIEKAVRDARENQVSFSKLILWIPINKCVFSNFRNLVICLLRLCHIC